ncbi:MAG: AraC family transcriptional regulator [Acetatifactor sp.]
MAELTWYQGESVSFRHSIDPRPNPDTFKLHNHASYEIYYFISGKGSFFIEGNEYCLHSGDLLIMRSTEAHFISVDPSVPYERFTLHFLRDMVYGLEGGGELLKAFDKREAGRQNLFTGKDFKNGTCSALIANLMQSSDSNPRLQAVTNLYALLNEIRLAYEAKGADKTPERESLAYSIISYINNHLEQQLTLDSICSLFFISKAQLCRIFKMTTGTTVGGYIAVKRLTAARERILEGIPATRAYLECGFNDYSAFYRAYRKQFGCSPAADRGAEKK